MVERQNPYLRHCATIVANTPLPTAYHNLYLACRNTIDIFYSFTLPLAANLPSTTQADPINTMREVCCNIMQ